MAVTETKTTVHQAPYLEDFQKRLLEAAFARGETPVNIPGIEVAGMTDLQKQAATAGAGIGQYQDYLTQGAGTLGTGLEALQAGYAGVPELFTGAAQTAAGSAGQYDPTSAQAFMDPYQQNVTQNALAEMRRQADLQRNALSAQAQGAGAFGGSRQGLSEVELDRSLADVQSRRIFEDLSRNYGQAQNAAQTAFESQQRRQQGVAQLLGQIGVGQAQAASQLGAGIGTFGTQQANLAGMGQGLVGQEAQLLSQLGATQQTQAQRELDAARQTELQQAYEPFQRISYMSDIFKPSIGSAGSTLGSQVAPSPSPWSQAIGAGIAGLGINQGLKNPFGAMMQGWLKPS
jgi:hypothetical protein